MKPVPDFCASKSKLAFADRVTVLGEEQGRPIGRPGIAHLITERRRRTIRSCLRLRPVKGRAVPMPNDVDELREAERLLREAEAKLRPAATFRQRTLLQMILFEVDRSLQSRNENGPIQSAVESERDADDD